MLRSIFRFSPTHASLPAVRLCRPTGATTRDPQAQAGRYQYAESQRRGHPDRIADAVAETVRHLYCQRNPSALTDIKAMVAGNRIIISGQVSTPAEHVPGKAEIQKAVRTLIADIGYHPGKADFFNHRNCVIDDLIEDQSPELTAAFAAKRRGGAGANDQAIVYGFACDETPNGIPLTLAVAHQLRESLDYPEKRRRLSFLRPDGRVLVTAKYDAAGNPTIDYIGVAIQITQLQGHEPLPRVLTDDMPRWLRKMLPNVTTEKTVIECNPAGRFTIGGPQADTGMSGAQLSSDNYGPGVRNSGIGYTGKDPRTKIHRAASYWARYIARNAVATGFARQAEVDIAYLMGNPNPIALSVNLHNPRISREKAERAVRGIFDLTPEAISEQLDLPSLDLTATAVGGHFGRTDIEFPWERTDRADALRTALEKLL